MLDFKYGHASALVGSLPVDTGVVIVDGQWTVFDTTTGKLKKQSGAYDAATQGVALQAYGGNDVRFDTQALKVVSVALGKSYVGVTDQFASVTINPGDPLTLQDGVITKATLTGTGAVASTAVIGYALSANATGGSLTFTKA